MAAKAVAKDYADPYSLVKGDVIEFEHENLPADHKGPFKVVEVWENYRQDEDGRIVKDPYMGCNRLYALVGKDEPSAAPLNRELNNKFIYKASFSAADTLQRNSFYKSTVQPLPFSYRVKYSKS